MIRSSSLRGRFAFAPFIALVTLAGLISLGGCARTTPPAEAGADQNLPASSIPADPPTTPDWAAESPVTLQVGVPDDLSQSRGLPKAIVTVDSITENASCPSGQATPSLGQFLAVKISATRTVATATQFDFSVYSWATVDASGTHHVTDAALSSGLCLTDGSKLPLDFSPDGKVSGTMLIDAPAAVASILATNTTAVPPVTVTIAMPAK